MKDGTIHLAFKLCAHFFAHNLDRGGMRRTWLRARERAQAVHASRHRPQSLIAEAPTHRRRHAAGGRGRRIWLYLRARYTHYAVLVAQILLIVSEDGETAFAALCFVVG